MNSFVLISFPSVLCVWRGKCVVSPALTPDFIKAETRQVLMTKKRCFLQTTRDIRGLHDSWIRPVSILRVITSSHRHPEQAATQHKGRCYSCTNSSDFILVKREKKVKCCLISWLSVCTHVNNPWKIRPAGTQSNWLKNLCLWYTMLSLDEISAGRAPCQEHRTM